MRGIRRSRTAWGIVVVVLLLVMAMGIMQRHRFARVTGFRHKVLSLVLSHFKVKQATHPVLATETMSTLAGTPAPLSAMPDAPGAVGDLLEAPTTNWAVYGGNHPAWHYSALTQITRQNVSLLKPVWMLKVGADESFETSPIVVDGVMYFTTPWNHVYAVNAVTGQVFWTYVYPLPRGVPLWHGPVNRGPAVANGKVIFTTLNAHIVALNAGNGLLAWDTPMADYTQGYSATTAPQIAGNKAIVGISGGESGVRGFLDAYDLSNGHLRWRFYTVPAPGEPGNETWTADSWKSGGGAVWQCPTYDPATNTIFAGVGKPTPALFGDIRQGENLYTDCIIALDANSGKLQWHYQTVPHDVWQLDAVLEPVIADITYDGQPRKVVLAAAKNGYCYVLDRTNGKFIYALPYVHQLNWGYVDASGVPHPDQKMLPAPDRYVTVYPGSSGGKEWVPMSYDPQRKRIYIPVIEQGQMYKALPQAYQPGQPYPGGISAAVPNSGYGHLIAIDVETKRIAWDTRTDFPLACGVLSTAGGLVITGTPDQRLLAFDADTGKILWQYRAISGWHSAPISFTVAGKQYLAFANGWGGWATASNAIGSAGLHGIPLDETMYVFALP